MPRLPQHPVAQGKTDKRRRESRDRAARSAVTTTPRSRIGRPSSSRSRRSPRTTRPVITPLPTSRTPTTNRRSQAGCPTFMRRMPGPARLTKPTPLDVPTNALPRTPKPLKTKESGGRQPLSPVRWAARLGSARGALRCHRSATGTSSPSPGDRDRLPHRARSRYEKRARTPRRTPTFPGAAIARTIERLTRP